MVQGKGFTKESKYRILLITITGFILLTPLSINYNATKWINATLFVFLLCGVSLNIKSSRHAAWMLLIFGLIAVGANLGPHETIFWPMISKISGLIFFLYSIILFGANIFSNGHHDLDHIYGSIIVYLLIGVTYSYIFMIINLTHPMSLIYASNNSPVTAQFDFYYFSFISLTTLGFGDIVANDGLTKAFTMVECVTGVFYLAILVAGLTNLLSRKLR